MGTRIFLGKPPANIEQWIKANFQSDITIYKVQTTSTYKKTGIYSAERNKASKPVEIDWGDGTVETVDGNVSQKPHTYDSVGEFTVKVSNIKTFAASANNNTWCSTTSQNRYTLKELVSLNKAVTSIEDFAFCDCNGLTSVMIPDSVTNIGTYAFRNCFWLTSMTIPDSITSIGTGAFWGCSRIASMTIPDNVTSIGNYVFQGCSGLTSVTIGNGVTSIGTSTFYDCSGLTDVVIGNSVTNIEAQAFYKCDNLVEVYAEGMTCEYVKSHALEWSLGINSDFTKRLVVVYCSDGVVVLNDADDSSSGDSATKVTYVDGTKKTFKIKGELTSSSIDNISTVKKVEIGDGVTSIGTYAFRNCFWLTSMTIPDSITSIGTGAFWGCSRIASMTIPDNVTSIGNYVFQGCSGLTSVTIGNSVTSIGNHAFYNCSNLANVAIGNSVTSIGYSAFDYCGGLTSMTIPASVTSIGSDAFNSCNGLMSFTLSGKTRSTASDMPNFSWSLPYSCVIHCTDGDITAR